MSKPVLYIAGPMSGIVDFNYPAFNEAERDLKAVGYEVINPAGKGGEGDSGEGVYHISQLAQFWDNKRKGRSGVDAWVAYIIRDIKIIHEECGGIALLPDWRYSKGARIEEIVAVRLGYQVMSVQSWLNAAGKE